jgi:hypothetical protein
MAGRRSIQQSHERANVENFLYWFNNAYRSNFKVVSEPNPPDAIIRSARTTRWIEVSTAFWSVGFAKDCYSAATPGEDHKPVGSGPYLSADANFAKNFVSVVKKKLEKTSYVPSRDQYGAGYLVVPIQYPLLSRETVRQMKDEWMGCSVADLGCFRRIYIGFSSLNKPRFYRWPSK